MVTATVPVVVSSRTSDGIERSRSLAIVPYGDGQISIHRGSGGSARVVTHLFGGESSPSQAPIVNGALTLPLATQNAANVPVEWLEVLIS
jgi:hypothetical protein